VVGFEVDGTLRRLIDLSSLSVIDKDVYADLDTPQQPAVLPTGMSSGTNSFYKDIGPVRRPQGHHQTNPIQPSRPRKSQKKPPKPSSKRMKRTLNDVKDSGPSENDAVKKRKRSAKSQQWDKLRKNSELLILFLRIDIIAAVSCADL